MSPPPSTITLNAPLRKAVNQSNVDMVYCTNVNVWNYAHCSVETVKHLGLWLLFCREAVLRWQAVGNHQCSGTWKKVQKTQQCNCPPQHSFVFIWSKPSTSDQCSDLVSTITSHSRELLSPANTLFRSDATILSMLRDFKLLRELQCNYVSITTI